MTSSSILIWMGIICLIIMAVPFFVVIGCLYLVNYWRKVEKFYEDWSYSAPLDGPKNHPPPPVEKPLYQAAKPYTPPTTPWNGGYVPPPVYYSPPSPLKPGWVDDRWVENTEKTRWFIHSELEEVRPSEDLDDADDGWYNFHE